ncbi:hypothetical protein [Providencia stuartii]|nr:hypothetical protein [Providencia stuartii]
MHRVIHQFDKQDIGQSSAILADLLHKEWFLLLDISITLLQ